MSDKTVISHKPISPPYIYNKNIKYYFSKQNPKMEHLFIARHADYDYNRRISEKGRKQMETLADAIKGMIDNTPAHILSSTAPRAMDSSEELAQYLNAEIEHMPYLWSGGDAPRGGYDYDESRLARIVQDSKADALILMTHLEVVSSFPDYFVRDVLGTDMVVKSPKKGQAIYIDFEIMVVGNLPE
ncbi:histidine phosphatase family protein [candidate division KSB1 bacterium]